MTTPSSVASLSFFCLLLLLLPAQHGASSHASYKVGSKRIFFKTTGKSSGNSQQASTVPPATTCSSIATGSGNNKLPVVHRQSPCSPLHGLPSLTAADVLLRDASLIRRRFSLQSSLVTSSAPSPAVTTIAANGSSGLSTLPGTLDFSVLVCYGTPEQQFPLFLDTSIGASLLRCKPCASGSGSCGLAFNTSQSSTFAHVPCASPGCPANCFGGSACLFDDPYSRIQGTFVQDVLTLAPSIAVHDFRFVCVDMEEPSDDLPKAGTLDLSHARNSLPSRLSSPWLAPAVSFSYCLPHSSSSEGFLYLGGNATVREDNLTVHAPMVWNNNPELRSMYFVDLVGMSLGDEDLLIPVSSFGGYGTNLDVGTTFSKLMPDVYTSLRDSFRKQMSQYNLSLTQLDGFDTCFNFTGLNELIIPLVRFKFGNGESLLIDVDQQMLYYDDPAAGPFTMACLAFSSFDSGYVFSSVIGTYTLVSTEVVYDEARGRVAFIPHSC